MAILFPFPSSKAQVRAMSSDNWAGVPGANGLASMVSKLEITAYPAVFFFFSHPRQSCFHQCTRFPQDWSGPSGTPSRGFVQWFKVSRQE